MLYMFFYVVDSKMSSILTNDCILFSGETDPKERLARQRKQLQKKLGLDMGAAIGMDTEELFNDEDLEDACASSTNRSQPGKSLGCHFSANYLVSGAGISNKCQALQIAYGFKGLVHFHIKMSW